MRSRLLLRLREGVSVGGGLPSADLLRHLEVLSERVDLGLVEMHDGLEVGGPIPLLHEEPLIVLDKVRRSGDGKVQAIGVVVLHHHPRSLLEIGGCHEL